ncbi:MAG TPA: TMEM165/GDT1 family protein [Ilumatobacteraceae bacterium]|nr:TMEM165/GDT1 family protein [Ilumatobacteraceae bacterium]
MIVAFFVAFGTVFLAELPDKTMFASLVLTTRYRRPLAVWTGVSAAFAGHVLLAVTLGSLLRRLPTTPVRLVVAALFIIGGLIMLRGGDDDEEVDADLPPEHSFGKVALTAASVVGLAEFGDLTQLATAGIATRYHAFVAVALGAWLALASVAALAVTAGRWIVKRVPLKTVQRVAGVLFIAFGLYTAITTIHGWLTAIEPTLLTFKIAIN